MKALGVALVICAAVVSAGGQSTSPKHKITIAFDYDFSQTPICPVTNNKPCVTQFNLYDVSAGLQKKTKLMSFSPPVGAAGKVKGISATTPPLVFESGRHLLAVTAQMSKGDESDPRKCTLWVDVP